jgi:hypothetical protein
MPQKHDIGYQKRLKSTPPMEIDELKLHRAKAVHPGPLPERLKNKDDEDESAKDYARRILTDAQRLRKR